jgi:hypothetical protein
MAREAVDRETPAAAATSAIVGRPPFVIWGATAGSSLSLTATRSRKYVTNFLGSIPDNGLSRAPREEA